MKDRHAKEHMTIANTIRLAKKRMFEAHRSGDSLEDAGRAFMGEVWATIQTSGSPEKMNNATDNSVATSKRTTNDYAMDLGEIECQVANGAIWDMDCEPEQHQTALIKVLNIIAHGGRQADSLALEARNLCFARATPLIDGAVDRITGCDTREREIAANAEHDNTGDTESTAGEFDPVTAVEHLISVFCGGLTPRVEADMLYNLLTLAGERQEPLDAARLAKAKRVLFAYTTAGLAAMETLDASISGKVDHDEN